MKSRTHYQYSVIFQIVHHTFLLIFVLKFKIVFRTYSDQCYVQYSPLIFKFVCRSLVSDCYLFITKCKTELLIYIHHIDDDLLVNQLLLRMTIIFPNLDPKIMYYLSPLPLF